MPSPAPRGVVPTALPQILIFISVMLSSLPREPFVQRPQRPQPPTRSSAAAPSTLSSRQCLTHSLCAELRMLMPFCSVVRPTLDLHITGEAQRGDAGGSGLVCMRPVSFFYLTGLHLLSLLSPRGASIHEGFWGRGGLWRDWEQGPRNSSTHSRKYPADARLPTITPQSSRQGY